MIIPPYLKSGGGIYPPIPPLMDTHGINPGGHVWSLHAKVFLSYQMSTKSFLVALVNSTTTGIRVMTDNKACDIVITISSVYFLNKIHFDEVNETHMMFIFGPIICN